MQIFQTTVAAGQYVDLIAAGPITPAVANINITANNATFLQWVSASGSTLGFPILSRATLPVTAAETHLWLFNPSAYDEVVTVMVVAR